LPPEHAAAEIEPGGLRVGRGADDPAAGRFAAVLVEVVLNGGGRVAGRGEMADVVESGTPRGFVVDICRGDRRRIVERDLGQDAAETVIGEVSDLALGVGLVGEASRIVVLVEPGLGAETLVGIKSVSKRKSSMEVSHEYIPRYRRNHASGSGQVLDETSRKDGKCDSSSQLRDPQLGA